MNIRAVDDISLREISSYRQLTDPLRSIKLQPARRRVYMSIVRQAGGWYCRFHRDSQTLEELSDPNCMVPGNHPAHRPGRNIARARKHAARVG